MGRACARGTTHVYRLNACLVERFNGRTRRRLRRRKSRPSPTELRGEFIDSSSKRAHSQGAHLLMNGQAILPIIADTTQL